MTVNKENMEKWCQELESWDEEPARGTLLDEQDRLCAVGIGLYAMEQEQARDILRGGRVRHALVPPPALKERSSLFTRFREWLDPEQKIFRSANEPDVQLDPGGITCSVLTVIDANDLLEESPWEIAQRLRATYLKDES